MTWRSGYKIGQEMPQRNVEGQLSPFVQQHRRSGGGHDLSHRSQIENGVGLDRRRVVFIGEAAESSQCNQRSAMRYRECGCREGALLDCFANDCKGPGELPVLEFESGWQIRELLRRMVQ